jgi:hypothetical protein
MKRNYRKLKTKDATSEELIFELIKRNTIQDAGRSIEFHTPHEIVSIRIGDDHTADIIIDAEAKKELDRLIANHNNLCPDHETI